jgi:hypothetical protein
MDQSCALDVVKREAERILQLTRAAETDEAAGGNACAAEIPTCPGWRLPDLANHVGRVYGWVATNLSDEHGDQPDRTLTPRRPAEQSPSDWMQERLDILLPILAALSETGTAWNFVEGPRAPAAFWWRRQAHESLIHRVDAELGAGAGGGAGAGEPVGDAEADVAADGIGDFLLLARLREVGWQDLQLGEGMTIHLHATDVEDAEWTIDTTNQTFATAHLKADVALRGSAWALDRWCWRRDVGASAAELGVETFGDLQAAADWRPAI